MKLVIHPEVEDDLTEAVRYQAGITQPLRYRVIGNGIRKCNLKRFPYALFFRVKGQNVQVLVVKHHRRSPDYEMDRS